MRPPESGGAGQLWTGPNEAAGGGDRAGEVDDWSRRRPGALSPASVRRVLQRKTERVSLAASRRPPSVQENIIGKTVPVVTMSGVTKSATKPIRIPQRRIRFSASSWRRALAHVRKRAQGESMITPMGAAPGEDERLAIGTVLRPVRSHSPRAVRVKFWVRALTWVTDESRRSAEQSAESPRRRPPRSPSYRCRDCLRRYQSITWPAPRTRATCAVKFRAHPAASAPTILALANRAGAIWPSALCGRTVLYSLRHISIRICTSFSV